MAKQSEQERLLILSERDRAFWTQDGVILAGMDEVGRGPLAGPVVVACCAMPQEPLIPYVNDSKKLSEKRRIQVEAAIRETMLGCHIAWVEPAVIDEINILQATKRAFEEAYRGMPIAVTDVMIDAMTGLSIDAEQHVIVHGDAQCYSIAAASILAKVARDAYMCEQDALYPEYGFAKNKGYGTAEHIAAIKKYGPCPIHRRSFIKNFI